MINGLFFIFSFQLIGTALQAVFGLSVPGPVIGMGLLLVWLFLGFKTPASLAPLCDWFLRYLPLLFVPAAVGVINYQEMLFTSGVSLLAIIVVSTLAALLVSVLSFIWVASLLSPPIAEECRSPSKDS